MEPPRTAPPASGNLRKMDLWDRFALARRLAREEIQQRQREGRAAAAASVAADSGSRSAGALLGANMRLARPHETWQIESEIAPLLARCWQGAPDDPEADYARRAVAEALVAAADTVFRDALAAVVEEVEATVVAVGAGVALPISAPPPPPPPPSSSSSVPAARSALAFVGAS